MKKALITGLTGQDGSYLAELLFSKGYEVHGMVRRTTNINTFLLKTLQNSAEQNDTKLVIHYGDLDDAGCINKVVKEQQFDEIYNLAAQSHVKVSFDVPEYTADINGLGPLRILEAIKNNSPKTKFYQASTSEMFGNATTDMQNEETEFDPQSPYAASKVFAHQMVSLYRNSYNMFACSGILFNHESPRRGKNFLTRKVTRGVANIKLGKKETLELGNMYSQRDWGYAVDYVEAMWLMLQQEKPQDFVIATGITHQIKDFVNAALDHFEFNYKWEGEGLHEKCVDLDSGKPLVTINEKFFRPAEVHFLRGDSSKAEKELGWKPKHSFEDLVKIMCEADFEAEKAS